MSEQVHISVIVPVYGCPECLVLLYTRLERTLSALSKDFEILFINDASPDESWSVIASMAKQDPRVKGINLSRNFGQHKAITAGLDYASGDWIVVMDCDLQDKPEEIDKLYQKAMEGHDVVFARRITRKDSLSKRMSSKIFYKVFGFFTDSKIDDSVANFSLVSRKVVDNLKALREQNRLYPLFVNWVGFERADVNVEHSERESGDSSYTFSKLFGLAISSIVSQSNKPLLLSIQFGFFLAFCSVAYGLFLVIRFFYLGTPVQGWTSLMVSLYFVGGLLFANMGILGLYIGKVFDEVKSRPLYVVDKTTFCS